MTNSSEGADFVDTSAAQVPDMTNDARSPNDVAIIGMACRVPGAADYEEYWQNLIDGRTSVREIPPSRWDNARFYSPEGGEGKSHSKWCGIVENIDQFDARFFNTSSREACGLDPQQRLLLEETVHCLEDAGISRRQLEIHRTGVFVGFATGDYQQMSAADDVKRDTYAVSGNFKSGLSNRISYYFNLKGPSLSIDAACASSLVALHEGVKSIQTGECEFAIVGGVNVNVHPWKYIIFSKANMLSRDGLCRPFDINANGYVPGDGVGVVLLQKRDDAARQRHRILGIIRGSACNHNGRSTSITAPSLEAQREAILAAYRKGGVSSRTVTYIEAHGTGTSLGDPIEVEGLNQAFRSQTSDKGFCHIGSVKSNIGHLEGAAGVAGLIKVLLMLRARWLPKTLHIQTLNPIIDFARTPFMPVLQPGEWRRVRPEIPLRAGISSFGFTGANAHVLLEEAERVSATAHEAQNEAASIPNLFMVSARSSKSLSLLVDKWKTFVLSDKFKQIRMTDLCGTLLNSRCQYEHRFGFALSDKNELADKLAEFQSEPRVKPCKWWLRIGEFHLSGYRDIRNLVESCSMLKAQLESLLDEVGRELAAGSIAEGFYAEQWRQPYQAANQLIFAYAYVRTLMAAGFQPSTVDAEGRGIYLAWVVCEMVGIGSMVRALVAGNPMSVRLGWPTINIYDRVHEREIRAYDVTDEYVKSLIADAKVQTDEVDYYIRQSQSLLGNQFSFRRNLEEWTALGRQKGLNVGDLLAPGGGDASSPVSDTEKLCFVLAAANALDRVKTKWQLTGLAVIANPALKELLELTNDEVISKGEVIQLIADGSANPSPSLIESMNSRIDGSRNGNRYPILRNRKPGSPIDDLPEWMRDFEQFGQAAPVGSSEHRIFHLCGSRGNNDSQTVVATLPGAKMQLQDEVLLKLWLAGVDIRWDALLEGQLYSKVSLPLYEFDRQRYWIEVEGRQQPVVSPAAQNKPADELFFAEKVWTPLSVSVEARDLSTEGVAILTTSSSRATADRLIATLPGIRAVVLELSDTTRKVSDSLWRIDRADSTLAFRDLMEEAWPINAVVDLSDLDSVDDRTHDTLPLARIAMLQFLARQQEVIHFFHFTQGLQTFQATGVSLSGARFAGLVRMLGGEYRRIYSKTIDIDASWNSAEKLKEILLQEWVEGSYHAELIYRRSGRYVPEIVDARKRSEFETSESWVELLNANKTVVITGGTRGLGLVVAKLCADRGVRRLGLIGVSPLPHQADWQTILASESASPAVKEKLRPLQGLKDRGVKLCISTEGMGPDAVDSACLQIKGELGPIHGVIHSAGLLDLEHPSFVNKPFSSFAKVCEPKVGGLVALHQSLKDEPLDFFVVFSSIASAIPRLGTGFSDYALANGFMDYFVEHQVSLGRRYFRSIQWLNWTIGMGNVKGTLYDDLGFLLIDPQSGLELIGRHGFGMPATVLAGIRKVGSRLTDAFRILKPNVPRPVRQPREAEPQRTTKRDPVLAVPAPSSQMDRTASLIRILADELRVPVETVDPEAAFADLGLDSIVLASLIRSMEKEFSIVVEPWVLLEFNSIAKLNTKLATLPSANNSTLPTAPTPKEIHPEPSIPGYSEQPIAVIGIGCHFSGADGKDAFLAALTCAKTTPPVSADAQPSRSLSINHQSRHEPLFRFLRDIESFDEEYFEINKETALHLDPAARQVLETAAEAIQDAGYTRESISGSKVGVFIGGKASGYHNRIGPLHKSSVTGIGQNFIAAHVSHFFNLKGPSLVVDAGTNSSISSLILAAQSLRSGQCELVLVGGVDILLDDAPDLLKEGRPGPSVIWGEGAGCVLLKPLEQAIKDGNEIYAVLDSIGVHYGRNSSASDLKRSLEVVSARMPSWRSVSVIESVRENDTEMIREAAGGTLTPGTVAVVGSVEAVSGRLGRAAGIASFIKLLLSLHQRTILSASSSVASEDLQTAGLVDRDDVSASVIMLREFRAAAATNYRKKQAALSPLQFRRNSYWAVNPFSSPGMLVLARNGSHYEFTVKADNLILRDHRVYRQGVLPGVTYLDLVYRALIAEGWISAEIELRNILFTSALSLEQGAERVLEVHIDSLDRTTVRVQSHSTTGQAVDVHMTCEVLSSPAAPSDDLPGYGGDSGPSVDLDAGYAIMRRIGIKHGEFMKGLGQIHDKGPELIAHIRLSECARRYNSSFFLHPALLDSATVVPFVYAQELSPDVAQKPYIPIFIEAFRAHRSIQESSVVQLEKRSLSNPSPDLFYSDVTLFDSKGVLTATMKKLCVKQIRSQDLMERIVPLEVSTNGV